MPQILERELNPLGLEDVLALKDAGAQVLDVRDPVEFARAHLVGSLNIGLGGQFASWAGSLIKPDIPVIIIAEEEERVREARTRLARVGLENVAGYLAGGVLAWNHAGLPLIATEQVGVEELSARLREDARVQVLDVRRLAEWKSGHIKEAIHIPLDRLAQNPGRLDRNTPVAAICAGGYRSSIATSIMEQQGFVRITNVVGGMAAWLNAKLDIAAAPKSSS